MSNMIEGVSQIGAQTASQIFENPAGGSGSDGNTPTISSMAEAALSSIGKLQHQMEGGLAPVNQAEPAVQSLSRPADAERVPEGMVSEQAHILAEQIEASTRVQAQLVQFVMASSMSSSLGRNLNMFLRGQ